MPTERTPHQVSWYLAEIVLEIVIEDDPRNVVHANLVLIRAGSPEHAYEKAMSLGRSNDDQYANPNGKLVTCRFRGLADLNLIYDPLEDSAELAYTETINRSEAEIKSLVRAKNELGVFAAPRAADKPDYSCGEIVSEVYARWPRLRKG